MDSCELFLARAKGGFLDLKVIAKKEGKNMDRVAAIVGAIVQDNFLAA